LTYLSLLVIISDNLHGSLKDLIEFNWITLCFIHSRNERDVIGPMHSH